MTVDKVRPLLAFAFVAALCAGVLAAGMNRAPAHRVVTETRIPATALPRVDTLVLGSTLQSRHTLPSRVAPSTSLSTLAPTDSSDAVVATAAVAVSAPRRSATLQQAATPSHRATTRPVAAAKPGRPAAKPAKPTPAATTTQPTTGNPSAPGKVKKATRSPKRTATASPKKAAKQKKRAAALATFTHQLLPGVPTSTSHGKSHTKSHGKSHAKSHAKPAKAGKGNQKK